MWRHVRTVVHNLTQPVPLSLQFVDSVLETFLYAWISNSSNTYLRLSDLFEFMYLFIPTDLIQSFDYTQVVLWGTAPWIYELPQVVTPGMRTAAILKKSLNNEPLLNLLPGVLRVQELFGVYGRMSLDRIRKFLKLETVHHYTCPKTGEDRIASHSGVSIYSNDWYIVHSLT